jgi:hypothetical protein
MHVVSSHVESGLKCALPMRGASSRMFFEGTDGGSNRQYGVVSLRFDSGRGAR